LQNELSGVLAGLPRSRDHVPEIQAGPINGDVVSDADLNREKMKIDISALLGGDVYRCCANGARKRKAASVKSATLQGADRTPEVPGQTCQCRRHSAEVLMSLPSPDEIARRAEEAKSKRRRRWQARMHEKDTVRALKFRVNC